MFRFFIVLLIAFNAQARSFDVSHAEIEEYQLSQGRNPLVSKAEAKGIAEEILQHQILAQLWTKLGHKLNEAQLDELEMAHQDIAIRLTKAAWTHTPELKKSELESYFDQATLNYFCRHILCEKESGIREVERRLAAGEAFEDVAKDASVDPGSAELGGALGIVRVGDTVAEFEDAMLTLKDMQVSPPFLTPFGWHVVRMDSVTNRPYAHTEQNLKSVREHLERKKRRYAELDSRRRMMQKFNVVINMEIQSPTDIVVSSRDTSMTARELDANIRRAFSENLSEDMFNDGLRRAYAENWIENIGWLAVSREEGIWLGEETLDRISLVERLMKSALFAAQEVVPGVVATDRDCWNYVDSNPGEFLEFQNDIWRRLVFSSAHLARAARQTIMRDELRADKAIELVDESVTAKNRGVPFEMDFSERSQLPQDLQRVLADTPEGGWSKVVPWQKLHSIWYRVGRRLPDIEESSLLYEAVKNRVLERYLDAELARIVGSERERLKIKKIRIRG